MIIGWEDNTFVKIINILCLSLQILNQLIYKKEDNGKIMI